MRARQAPPLPPGPPPTRASGAAATAAAARRAAAAASSASAAVAVDADDAKGERRPRRAAPGAPSPLACALLLLLALLALAAPLALLGPALLRAYLNERSADHPSEASFQAFEPAPPGTPAAGPVVTVAALGRGPRESFPLLVELLPAGGAARRPATSTSIAVTASASAAYALTAATLALSVIVPAYNEEARLRDGLDEMVAFLSSPAAAVVVDGGFGEGAWEIIVVDDGSHDATADIVLREYVARFGSERVRLLRLHANSGKGAAVRKGMLRARGALLLMCDADGATRFSDVLRLRDALETTLLAARQGGVSFGSSVDADPGDALRLSALEGVAFGSRAHLTDQAQAPAAGGAVTGDGVAVKRSGLRRVLMWGFHLYMRLLLGGPRARAGAVVAAAALPELRDTQCGFKLFTRRAAQRIFPAMHIERWAFDVEIVFLARRLRVPVVEVPVQWHEVGGSKVDLASASLQMARDVLVVRLAYSLGWWRDDGGLGIVAEASPAKRRVAAAVGAARAAGAQVKQAAGRVAARAGQAVEKAAGVARSVRDKVQAGAQVVREHAKESVRQGLAAAGLRLRTAEEMEQEPLVHRLRGRPQAQGEADSGEQHRRSNSF